MRVCTKCHKTILSQYNPTDICGPCTGPLEGHEWALGLLSGELEDSHIALLARTTTGRHNVGRPRGEDAERRAERNRAIEAEYRAGGISQYELARKWGVTRTCVQGILDHYEVQYRRNQKRRDQQRAKETPLARTKRERKEKAAVTSGPVKLAR